MNGTAMIGGCSNISVGAQDWDNGPDGAPKLNRVGEYRRTHHPDRLGSELTAMRLAATC